jgi:hypothetical protein
VFLESPLLSPLEDGGATGARGRVRKPKPKTLDEAIANVVQAESVVVPPLNPYEALQLKGQQVTRKMNATHLEAAEIYYEIYTQKLWEHFGFADSPEYFDEVIGVAYRTAMRAIQIWESHLAIPEETRAEALRALEGIGVNKASIVAPAIKEHPLEWTKWTQSAREMSREALQEQVTKARGLPTKAGTAGDRLYNTFVSRLTKEQREEFEGIFRAGKAVAESEDFVVITTLAYIEAGASWIPQADRIRKGHGNA